MVQTIEVIYEDGELLYSAINSKEAEENKKAIYDPLKKFLCYNKFMKEI
ncbi:MAG: hypothetical protein ABRQ38_19760 [Candidatus Eremiobacterota bacterium]